MQSPTVQSQAATPRDMLMWALLGVLAVGQLVAFWMLCSQQVLKAQERDASAHVQRVAVADCLSYMPRSTFHSCARGAQGGAQPQAATNVPVNFTFR